jgi:hypothetical protein
MMRHGHLTPFWIVVFTILIVATFTPWGRLRNALRRLRGPLRRGPGPAHPAAEALRSGPSGLTDDEEARWRVLEAELRGTPEQRNGEQR